MRSSRLRFGRALILGIPLLSAWACGGSDKEKLRAAELAQGCSLNSDCKDPLACTFERCHQVCEQDRDCNGEERCVKGADGNVCQLPVETACTRDAQCNGDQICGDDGECRDTCTTAADCTEEQVCAVSGECASSDTSKDIVDESGNIVPDPYDDTKPDGSGGAGGSDGGPGTGGKASSGGSTGSGGKASSGGTTGSGGAGGASGGSAGAGGGSGECPAGLGDCDDDPSDCETSLALITTCGACDVTCDPAHGKVKCDPVAFMCVIDEAGGGCLAGYDDCNMDGKDGCEAALATDPENCGKCGQNCGTGTCMASQCLAEVVMKPMTGGAVSYGNGGETQLVGDQLFKLNNDSGTEVRTVTLPPESPPVTGDVFVTSTSTISATYADTTNFYYSLGGSPATVLYKPITGTASTAAKTAVNMPDTYPATIIVSSGTALYMASTSSGGMKITTAPKPSGTTVATAGVITGLETVGTVYDLVASGQRLFWAQTQSAEQAVYTTPLAGGTPVALDTTIGSAYYVRLVSDGKYVYWNTYNGTSSRIRRVLVAGSPTESSVEDLAVGLSAPGIGIAVDPEFLYFFANYQIYRVSTIGDMAPEPLANLDVNPWFYGLFAVDDTHVYGTGYYGEILRSAKDAVSTAQ